ncbi:hypothetical protein B4099_2173 [Heyndrickxia coagulans]|uniref:Uncharacterized protein n=1 Tax=Heyndrickxia coagulans TaxID=1398 RepID=A0A150KEE4_HEYCO|nr:hypothetical protein B4099_2173 [Heyndrickxia coagulans]
MPVFPVFWLPDKWHSITIYPGNRGFGLDLFKKRFVNPRPFKALQTGWASFVC